jgi:phosphoglycerate dehydrogenase-like enzyme
MNRIVVTSKTFSSVEKLRQELLAQFSNVEFNFSQVLGGDALADFIAQADGVIVGLEDINSAVLEKCPALKIVAKYGVGLDNIDAEACNRLGIEIGWTGGVNRLSVAEMTLGLMLALSRNLYLTSNQLKKAVWNKDGGLQLTGRTIGIIGVGNIGKEVIRVLKPFACNILVNDIVDQSQYYSTEGVKEVSKEEIYKNAHIVSVHVPLTAKTHHMINARTLRLMQPSAYLINTARGPIVDLSALTYALKNRIIAGSAIDVYDEEPPENKDLLGFENLINTPHIGGNSKEAVMAMGMSAIGHLQRYFANS